MKEWEVAQKSERVKENILYHFSHTLSWLLNQIVKFLAEFLKAMIDAVKMFLHF